VIGLPIYIIIVVNLVAFLPNLPKVLEFLMYVFLGIVWVFPLKLVFQGIGQPDRGDGKSD
jgi:hypothetical protein